MTNFFSQRFPGHRVKCERPFVHLPVAWISPSKEPLKIYPFCPFSVHESIHTCTFYFLHNWIDTVCTVVWLDVFHITYLIDLSMHLYLGLPNFISYVRNYWLYHHLFNLPPTDKYLCFYTLETFPMFHIYKYVPSTSCTFIFEYTCHNTVKWKKRLQIYIYSPTLVLKTTIDTEKTN